MKFSLIIPVAPERNAEILETIEELDFPKKEFEVIIEVGKNPSKNRNNGAKRASGEYLIFLDDDALLPKSYLNRVEIFTKRRPEIDLFGGPQLTPKEDNFFAQASGVALSSVFGSLDLSKRYRRYKEKLEADEKYLTSANLIIKKSSFKKNGGFDEGVFPGEDPEFIQRAKKNGLRVGYTPEIFLFHKRRADFKSFCKQMFKYGLVRPKVNTMLNENKLLFNVPAIFLVYLLFITSLTALTSLFLFPLILYSFLCVVFAFSDSIRVKNFRFLFLLPFLYLSIHLCYGLGVIIGHIQK